MDARTDSTMYNRVSALKVLSWAMQAADTVRMVKGYGHDQQEAVDTLQRLAGEMEKVAQEARVKADEDST